jgi:hypothetical protein
VGGNIIEQLEEFLEDLALDEYDAWVEDVFVPMYLHPDVTSNE